MTKRLIWALPALLVALALITPVAAERGSGPFSDRLAVKRTAARIDALVEAKLKENGLKPAPLADESTFARRTYLSIAGRIPTRGELEAFLKSGKTDKHLKLVDELLASRGHESRMFNWWADLLRVRSNLGRRTSGEPYAHWIKQAIHENRPYDEMVRELLSATGPVHQRGNGATGYLMRDRNMPEDNMSNTIRLFLGSRVECAQCHNHPFDKWTQKQYYQMVAFTGGIQYRKNIRQDERARRLFQQAQSKWGRNGRRAMGRTIEPLFVGIYGSGSGMARLPKDYQYEDGKPGDWIEAHPMFAPDVTLNVKDPMEDVRIPRRIRNNPRALKRFKARLKRRRAPEADTRAAFAEWMTARDNERFATVITNRLWKQVFGRGLIEPADDIKDDTVPIAPELQAALNELMLAVDFDLRAFQRALYYTRLWRRQAVTPADVPGKAEDLRGPLLRRMTAEQAWDSLLTLVVDDLDTKLDKPLNARAEQVYQRFDKLNAASDEEIMEQASALALRYTNPEKAREMRRKQQAEVKRKRQQARRKAAPLLREYKRAKRDGDDARMALIAAQLEQMGIPMSRGRRGGRALRDLDRASDLPSPAPGSHLLNELGQSQRDLIEAGHKDPTVPQVLALLNAFLEQRLLTNNGALLMREMRESRGGAAKVKTAFLTVLGRAPTSAERSMWTRDVSKGGPQATQDLVWTLVNTHEFLFIQ